MIAVASGRTEASNGNYGKLVEAVTTFTKNKIENNAVSLVWLLCDLSAKQNKHVAQAERVCE